MFHCENGERRSGSCWRRSAVKRWRAAPDTHWPHSDYGSRLNTDCFIRLAGLRQGCRSRKTLNRQSVFLTPALEQGFEPQRHSAFIFRTPGARKWQPPISPQATWTTAATYLLLTGVGIVYLIIISFSVCLPFCVTLRGCAGSMFHAEYKRSSKFIRS